MELILNRTASRKTCTISQLLADGIEQCFILEDIVREIPGQPVASWKVQNQTAIPCGRYQILDQYSPHFGRVMPHLQNVPGFTYVMIHPGNTAIDTDGCLLAGSAIGTDGESVTNSVAAYLSLAGKIGVALASNEEVWITIVPYTPVA